MSHARDYRCDLRRGKATASATQLSCGRRAERISRRGGAPCVAGYAVAFFFLSLTLRTIPVGIAYAIWAGAGILTLIVAGVMIVNTLSHTTVH